MATVEQCQAFVILNSASGTDDKDAAESNIEKIFHDSGAACEVRRVGIGNEDITELARKALRDGAERIIAAGGDGTLRAVAQAMVDTEVPMAVLPVGTLNHFARDLEIPLDDAEQAVAIAATGVPVDVDTGEVNGRVFINNAVLGLYPFYRHNRSTEERKGGPERWVILKAILRTLRQYSHFTLRMVLRGKELRLRTAYVLVANNQHSMEGYRPWARERLTDGQLWIYVLKPRTRMGLLWMLVKALFGRTAAADDFEVFCAEELTIETRRRILHVSLDGELVALATPLEFRSRPRALRVLVAPDSKRAWEA